MRTIVADVIQQPQPFVVPGFRRPYKRAILLQLIIFRASILIPPARDTWYAVAGTVRWIQHRPVKLAHILAVFRVLRYCAYQLFLSYPYFVVKRDAWAIREIERHLELDARVWPGDGADGADVCELRGVVDAEVDGVEELFNLCVHA